MHVICLEKAFYALVEQVVLHIKEKQQITEDKWISTEEAMHKLRISSKTTLQKLREGKIRLLNTNFLHRDVDNALSVVIGHWHLPVHS